MRAKEYAEKYNENPTSKNLAYICHEFILESHEIMKSRNITNDRAAIAVLKEQDLKWKSFASHVQGVNRNGFFLAVCKTMPEVGKIWESKYR